MPFTPNSSQEELIGKFSRFLLDPTEGKLFILRGYAGTGKTSLVSAVVRTLRSVNQRCILLAPTGRAAKVISKYASTPQDYIPAFTIHKYIYRQQTLSSERFSLNDNLLHNALFIVDEASMLSDHRDLNSPFGSGSLLNDLMHYVYNGKGCALMLVGDTAQLPPVMYDDSPALQDEHYEQYRHFIPTLHTTTHTLTTVARQALDSGILRNATQLRNSIAQQQEHLQTTHYSYHFPIIASDDVVLIKGSQLQQQLEQSYNQCGMAQTLIVTRSNKRTNIYNQGVRAYILWKDDLLSAGDRIMVCRNNYFWKESNTDQQDEHTAQFIANGDMFDVIRLRKQRNLYGFTFADATLENIDRHATLDAILWLDTLNADDDEQIYSMQRQLFDAVAADFPEIHNRKDLIKAVYASPYYNALQVRYAYAVTCHKAQGGQWQHVYIDQGPVPDEQRDLTYLRWLYTALTRSTGKVFLINYE